MPSPKFLVFPVAIALGTTFSVGTGFAQQSEIEFQVCGLTCVLNSTYEGEAFDLLIGNVVRGSVTEANAVNNVVTDAYDGFGFVFGASSIPTTPRSAFAFDGYATGFNGLVGTRRTETYVTATELPNNSIRWFDSFTNETGSAITANIGFGGNLGSDSATYIHSRGDGYIVSGQNAPGMGSNDPVILFLYGNNDYAFDNVTVLAEDGNDNFTFIYPITVAPGETVSIMNLNVLYGDANRRPDADGAFYAQDVAAAIADADLYVNDPIFAGLSAAQIETIINWGNIVVDGTLPAAGAGTGLTRNTLDAFNNMLDVALSMGSNGFVVPQGLMTDALRYAASSQNQQTAGGAAIAQVLGQSGGNVALHQSYGSEAMLFGGMTTGSETFAVGTLDYGGYGLGAVLETEITPHLTLGMAAGFAEGGGSMTGVYTGINTSHYVFSPYVRWEASTGTLVDVRLTGSLDELSYARTAGVGTATAAASGHSFGARLGISQPFETDWATITPYASLSHLRSTVNGYQETGAGAANLNVPSYSSERLEALAGVGVEKDWTLSNDTVLTGYVRGGVGGNLLDDGTVLTSYTTSPTTYLNTIKNGTGVFGKLDLGLSAEVTPGLTLSAGYSGTFSKTSDQHTIMGRVSGKF